MEREKWRLKERYPEISELSGKGLEVRFFIAILMFLL